MPACRAAGGRGRQAAAAEGRAEASRELAPRSRLGLSGLFEAKLRRPPPGPSVWQMGGGYPQLRPCPAAPFPGTGTDRPSEQPGDRPRPGAGGSLQQAAGLGPGGDRTGRPPAASGRATTLQRGGLVLGGQGGSGRRGREAAGADAKRTGSCSP